MISPEENPARDAAAPAKEPRRPSFFERLTGPRLSPHGLLSFAAILSLAYMIMHLAGLRECTTIISGTSPTGNIRDQFPMIMGVIYILVYMVFTMIVPVLLIAAGLLALAFALPSGVRKEAEAD